jgi:hypothetical protein
MNAANRDSWDWSQLASLGENLRNKDSLSAQRDGIIAMANRLIEGSVDVWLNEKVFRLPDWKDGTTFPSQPKLDGIRQAIKTRGLFIKQEKAKSTASSRDLCRGPARRSWDYAGSAPNHPPQWAGLLQ